MAFRSVSPYRVGGLDGGGSRSRAALVPGGLVDGLADLAQAFIEAPIARRKLKMEEEKNRLDNEYRKLQLENEKLRNKQLHDKDLAGSFGEPASGTVVSNLEKRTEEEGLAAGMGTMDGGNFRPNVSEEGGDMADEFQGMRSANYMQAGVHPTNYKPVGPQNPYQVPDLSDTLSPQEAQLAEQQGIQGALSTPRSSEMEEATALARAEGQKNRLMKDDPDADVIAKLPLRDQQVLMTILDSGNMQKIRAARARLQQMRQGVAGR